MTRRSISRYLPIDREGRPVGFSGPIPKAVATVLEATRQIYATAGFREPWISYLALSRKRLVGCCGFKSPPVGDRVEIAYFTFPGFEGRGIATALAGHLVTIARSERPSIFVTAQTLPEAAASQAILRKLGFRRVAVIDHLEDGGVWGWELAPAGTFRPEAL